MAGVIMLTVTVMTGFRNVMILMMSIPFSLIGITALVLSLRTVFRYLKVKSRGKAVQATVYGYIDDNVLINDRPAQVVKLLIQTPEGPRFIFYQLGNTLRPYRINDKIDLIVYQNYFMICKTQKTVQW